MIGYVWEDKVGRDWWKMIKEGIEEFELKIILLGK